MGGDQSADLETIERWAERSNREVGGKVEGETDDGHAIYGRQIRHGNFALLALSTDDIEFFKLQFEFDVLQDIAVQICLEEENIDPEKQPDIELEVTPAHHQKAQRYVAERNASRDDEKLQKLDFKLVQELAHPDAGYQIKNDLNGPYGFKLSKKLFVDEESVVEFDRACQTLVSLAMVPRQLLARVYNTEIQIGEDTGDTEQSMPTAPGSRGFQ